MAPDWVMGNERQKVLVAAAKSQCLLLPTTAGPARGGATSGGYRPMSGGPSGGPRSAPYRFEKYVKIGALGHEGGGAPALGLAGDVLAEGDPAEHDDAQRRQRLRQLPHERQSAAPLQREIQDERVSLRAPRRLQHLTRIGNLSDAMHVGLDVYQLAHDIAEIAVVLRDQHSQGPCLL